MKWGSRKLFLNRIRQALIIALELLLFAVTWNRKVSAAASVWKVRVGLAIGWVLRVYIVLIIVVPLYILLGAAKTAQSIPDADVTVYATPLIAPTVTTDGGATNITETEARLRGEITDTGNENPEVWVFWGTSDGGTDPGSWSDNSNLGTLGLGVFYKDISSLTANTTYYYQCRATNAAGTDWAASSANFTTLPTGSIIGAPTDFAVTDLGAITVEISWTKGSSGNYTMIRASRTEYPADITEGELIYYGTASTINSTGYALDPTEYYFSAWGFWTDNTTHSATCSTTSIGGEFMEALADSVALGFADIADAIQFVGLLVMVIFMLAFALWQRDVVYFTAAGIVTFIIALSWVDDYPAVSIVISTLGMYLIFEALRLALSMGGPSQGAGQFRGMINKVRGWF